MMTSVGIRTLGQDIWEDGSDKPLKVRGTLPGGG